MSRLYQMDLTVRGYRPEQVEAIIAAANGEWSWGEDGALSESGGELNGWGDGSLYGGEGEDEFAQRLARAVFIANGGPCEVEVRATYLEELPHEDYTFDGDDYARLTADVEPVMAPAPVFAQPGAISFAGGPSGVFTNCRVCGRKLSDPASQASGIGPECAGKAA
jgi:hypothetical protein